MRTAPPRHHEAIVYAPDLRASQRGFSLVELLVTIVLAGIIFAAMVPLFVTALKRTSGDNARNVAQNIAQDRIEQIRLLGGTSTGYGMITQANLNYLPSPTANPFGDNKFGPTYAAVGTNVPWDIQYSVNPAADPHAYKKTVSVSVSKAGVGYTTTLQTIVNNPDANVTSATSTAPSPSPTISGLSITASFKNWSDATGSGHGVTVVRVQTNVTPNVTYTPTPTRSAPTSSSSPTVTWPGLTGGMAFTYTVICAGVHVTSTSPPFHLLKDARLKFDTNPGGS